MYKTKNLDFRDEFEEDWDHNLPIQDKKKALRVEDIPIDKSEEEIIDKLREFGVSQKNAKIFTKWKFEKITQRELARKYRFSERWIRKICRDVEKLLNMQ